MIKEMLILIALKLWFIEAIWPPAYKVNLSDQETFVIHEEFGLDDLYSDEDEMIKEKDLKRINFVDNNDKYFRIHKLAMRKNIENKKFQLKMQKEYKKIKENAFKNEESVPWIGGFVDKSGNFIINEGMNVYYSNEMVKSMLDDDVKEKREELILKNITSHVKESEYDYEMFKDEYKQEISQLQRLNSTFNYTDVKEDENFEEAVESLVDFEKKPRNCTKEESKGIGLAAMECFWADFGKNKTTEEKKVMAVKISKLLLVWICIYLIIAIPCWCQRGWCCCCFRCFGFCKPKERINKAKKFLMDNPPGIYHTEDDEILTYKPTVYEKHAHKKLEHLLMHV